LVGLSFILLQDIQTLSPSLSGVLSARHRWLFPKRSPPASVGASSSAKVDLWFNVHRILQLSGVALFSIGLILPWTAFGHGNSAGDENNFKQVRSAKV
jgi:hypothetical protein